MSDPRRQNEKPRRTVVFETLPIALAACLAAIPIVVAALFQGGGQEPRPAGVANALPAGPMLVLEARDLSGLVADWNASATKTKWLASDNYRAFARSRLFLRLGEAYAEFAAASGVPPDLAFLADVAGTDAALALYDIGKLEFLYVTRLPSARVLESALWRARGNYEPRQAAGIPFYVRIDPQSRRVVAFAAHDGSLLLATREDLIAGALALRVASGGRSVDTEGWFAQSVKAAGPAGDLRLVMNLQELTTESYVRSYWVQGNVSELKQYASGVSDMFRTPTEIREQRVFLRAGEKSVDAGGANPLGDVVRLVPENAGLYRAWASPSPEEAATLIMAKIVGTGAAAPARNPTAPRLGATAVSAQGDYGSRIDEEIRAPRQAGYRTAALNELVAGAPLTAMLHVESTRAGSDGVFIGRGSVAVLARATDWPPVRDAMRALVEPVWAKAGLGPAWADVRVGGQAFSQLEGLEPLGVAERGRLLFVGNDPALLAAVLGQLTSPPLELPGRYAAGFRHTIERLRFGSVMRLIDHRAAGTENREPMFFSENVASLSDTLSGVDRVAIVVRDERQTVVETVTYRLAR